jgi:hypothetical protein
MKKILTCLLAILVFACTQDDELQLSTERQVLSIEYQKGNQKWQEQYRYDASGKPVDKFNTFGVGQWTRLVYEGDQVKEIQIFSQGDFRMMSKDSFAYYPDGKLRDWYQFTRSGFSGQYENIQDLKQIYAYRYDEQGQLAIRTFYSPGGEKMMGLERFHWENNNVKKVDTYNCYANLLWENHYEYDQQRNFRKNDPFYQHDPLMQGDNNMVSDFWKNIGTCEEERKTCNPCQTAYKYDKANFPTSAQTPENLRMKINYGAATGPQ